jgi:hypothetical protein
LTPFINEIIDFCFSDPQGIRAFLLFRHPNRVLLEFLSKSPNFPVKLSSLHFT